MKGSQSIEKKKKISIRELLEENKQLKARLSESEELLNAIQSGSVDALVINNDKGKQVFTLSGADYPYRILIENMYEGAATISSDFDVMYCNRRLCDMLNATYQQIIGKHIESLIFPEDLDKFHQLLTQGQQITTSGEIRLMKESGAVVEVLLSTTPIEFENTLVCLVFAELTPIKKVQAELKQINESLDELVQKRTFELQESEQRWVTTLSSIGDAVIATNQQDLITFMNPEAEKLTGWKLLEVFDVHINEVLQLKSPGKKITDWKIKENLYTGKELSLMKENLLISKNDNRKFPIEVRVTPIKDYNEQINGFVYIFRDISQRKRAERKLRQSEERFRALITATSNVVFRVSPDWSRISLMLSPVSGNFFESTMKDYIQNFIPPEFHQTIQQAIQQAIQTRTVFSLEHPNYDKDHNLTWMFSRAVPILNKNNQITEWFGTSTDITSRKKAEEALKESEKRYLALFTNKLNGIIHCRIITNERGEPIDMQFLQVNEACEQLIGFKKEEIEGKTLKELYPASNTSSIDYILEYGGVAFEGGEIRFEKYFEGIGKYLSVYAYSPKQEEFIAIFSDITQRKLTENALVESENRFSVMFQAAPIALSLMTLERLSYYDVNQTWLDLFGFSTKKQVIGKTIFELGLITDKEEVSIFSDFRLNGRIRNYEERRRDINGGFHDLLINAESVELKGQQFILIALEDISDRKRFENELRESQQRWQTTLTSIGDAVISTDTTGRITFMNKAAEKLTQWNHQEAIHNPVNRFLKLEDSQFKPIRFNLIADLKSEILTDEYILQSKTGKKTPIEYSVSPLINKEGDKSGMVLIFRDITERKEAERLIKEYNLQLEKTVRERTAELEQAKERAESADKLKTAFLLNMSHELRTPLNSIIGFSGILLKQLAGPLNVEQGKQLEMVQSSGRHLLSLISDILDISKIEAGELKPEYSDFELCELIEEVIKIEEPQVKIKNLPLIFIKDNLPPLPVKSDKIRLRQVFINLLTNAIKFTENGRVEVRCFPENHASVKVEVRDTGIGIRKEDLDKLFNPFVQLENNLVRRFEGSGLGLSISKKIMEMLHGSIGVSSEYGCGSTFWITLPLNHVE